MARCTRSSAAIMWLWSSRPTSSSTHLTPPLNLRCPYPILLAQRAKLANSRIFHSTRSIRLTLKPRFLPGTEGPTGFTTFSETLEGSTVVTLKRL
jgi:hypothetical protein